MSKNPYTEGKDFKYNTDISVLDKVRLERYLKHVKKGKTDEQILRYVAEIVCGRSDAEYDENAQDNYYAQEYVLCQYLLKSGLFD